MLQLGGVLVLAAAIVAVIVIVSSGGGGGGSKSVPRGGAPAAGGPEARLLGGIPESEFTLGKAGAPVTLVEFNDMQCPFCRQYTSAVLPTLVQRYVRTGKLRMQMRLQAFIGPESVKAGKAVAAAAAQGKGWLFSDIFYSHQGEENTGYVTDDFLRSIAKATPGLSVSRLFADMGKPAAVATLKAGAKAFDAKGLDSTPSFLVGKTGGPMTVLRWSNLTPAQFTGPIDSLLGT